MTKNKLRRQIAYDAARLLYDRQESEYIRAKIKAASRLVRGRVKPQDLPSNAEIREQVQNFARMFEGETRNANLQAMRVEALRMMRLLKKYRPRLIGSVLTGHIRKGSDIDLHLFTDNIESVTAELEYHGIRYETEYKRVVKQGERQLYKHVHIQDRFEFELTVYPADKSNFPFRSSITGKPIEKANIQQLEQLLALEYPDLDLESAVEQCAESVDRFQVYYSLLLPLENVKQNPAYHPEGDVLYHSLQVYDLACNQRPYDEEFLLAALLHDVGKGIQPFDHVNAGLEALEGFITERTAWLIEHHMLAHKLIDKTIGARQRRRLEKNESFEELLLLGECDRAGRQVGVVTTELEDALDYLREISDLYG
jgi:predicted nucleotidyltransferase